MNKYAIVVTADYKFISGVSALINSCLIYGNEVDFHLLYWDKPGGPFDRYVANLQTDPRYDFLFPIHLPTYIEKVNPKGYDTSFKPKYYLKFWRHFYPQELLDYDAIVIFDADMMIVENIMQYFEIAAKTGRILIPRNSSIYAQQIDNYSESAFKHSYAPPCHSMPLFYDPKKHHEFFRLIPPLAQQMGRGEMVAINCLFHKMGIYKDLILLPNSLWLGTRWKELEYSILYGNHGIQHITVAGDRVFSIHGRWWAEETLDKIPQGERVGKANGQLFASMYMWLNGLGRDV